MQTEVLQAMQERRSCRAYLPQQVGAEELEAVLTAGTWAPTGMGAQSPVIVAVQDKATRDTLSRLNAAVTGNDRDPFYGAPTVLVVLADKSRHTCVEGCIYSGRCADRSVYDAAEPVAQCVRASLLGYLPQHSLCSAWASGNRAVLSQRKRVSRSCVPLDVVDHRAELWLLYPGGAVGGYHSHDWNAHDPQDLRLCVDRADRLLCHEKRVQIKE